MGKISGTIIMIMAFAGLAASCTRAGNESSQNGIVEIRERMFISQVNDVYINRQSYLGRTIKIEGIFIRSENNGSWHNFVGRNGPGCCGNDGFVGFEVSWDRTQTYPEHDSWVEAVGIVKDDNQGNYLYLDLVSLNVQEKRGRDQVFQ